jgi:hypothetical protein
MVADTTLKTPAVIAAKIVMIVAMRPDALPIFPMNIFPIQQPV